MKASERKPCVDPLHEKETEIQRLQYIIHFLQDSLRKRDEVAKKYYEENAYLREEIKKKNEIIKKYREKSSYRAESASPIKKSYISERESKNLDESQISQKVDDKSFLNSLIANKYYLKPTSAQNSRRKPSSKLNSSNIEDNSSKRNSIILKQVNKTETVINQPAVLVTNTQGLKHFNSLFVGKAGRLSVLQMTNKEREELLDNPKIKELESILHDDFAERMLELTTEKQLEIIRTVNSLIRDFRNFINIIFSLKMMIKANPRMSTSLIMEEAIDKLGEETQQIIKCERVFVFVYDEAKKELRSKLIPGSKHLTRFSLEYGIPAHVINTGKAVKIDNAALDPNFDPEFDTLVGFKTKTICAVPIRDPSGKVIGINFFFIDTEGCLHANNKLESNFGADDEELMNLHAENCGIIIKNIQIFDSSLITHYKLLKLQKLGNEMYEASKLETLIEKAENSIKELLGAEKGVLYIVDEKDQSFYKFNEKAEKLSFPLGRGIVGEVATTKKPILVNEAYTHPSYHISVDLDTTLPIMCLPIFQPNVDEKVLGVIQVLNLNNRSTFITKKGDFYDVEILNLFLEQVAICLGKFVKVKALVMEKSRNSLMLAFYKSKNDQEIRRKSVLANVVEQNQNNHTDTSTED